MAKYVAIHDNNVGMVCDSARAAVDSLIEDCGVEPDEYENILIAEILPMEVTKPAGFSIVKK